MAEPWLIYFFACNREMQPFSFFFVGYSLGGGGISGRVRALNLTVPLGSGWVRQSRVRAGFGLQFWARADLYTVLHILLILFYYLFPFHSHLYLYIYSLVLCFIVLLLMLFLFYFLFYYYYYFIFFALSIERTCPDLHFTTDYTLYDCVCDK